MIRRNTAWQSDADRIDELCEIVEHLAKHVDLLIQQHKQTSAGLLSLIEHLREQEDRQR